MWRRLCDLVFTCCCGGCILCMQVSKLYGYALCVCGWICVYRVCVFICEVYNCIWVQLCTHLWLFWGTRWSGVCESWLRVACAVMCICGTMNVRELFTYVVVHFGGLGSMCGSWNGTFLYPLHLKQHIHRRPLMHIYWINENNKYFCILVTLLHPMTSSIRWRFGFFSWSSPHAMWHLSFPTREQTCAPYSGSGES